MTSGMAGSAYRPHPDTEIRLDRWRRLASTGMSVADIAADLGIPRATLDRVVCRARKAGHPQAIYHPLAVLPGDGLSHLTDSSVRARRVRRRAQETR